jgi:NlpC/P60 family
VIPRITYAVPVCLLIAATDALARDAVDLASRLIGRPYVWGAEGPNSFDCSGLTQHVYQQVGIEIPRRAISQSRSGDPAGRRLQRGDLLFFSTDTRRSLVTHVGLYEGGGMMIEASKRHGRVRRTSLSDPYLVERFMFARRVGPSSTAGRLPERREPRVEDPPRRSNDTRRAAVSALIRIAEAVIERRRR